MLSLESIPEQGRFGGKRKFDTHTGVDLYCEPGTPVYAMEDGVVVSVEYFTGTNAQSPWWHDTKAVTIEGVSGVILYGEVETSLKAGDRVSEGQEIAKVVQVLKNDKGLPMTMLHLELYKLGYKGSGEWWKETQPEDLLDVETILRKVE